MDARNHQPSQRQKSRMTYGIGFALSFGVVLIVAVSGPSCLVLASSPQRQIRRNIQASISELTTGQLEAAKAEISNDITINPRSVRDHIVLGEVDFRLHDFVGSMRALREAILLDPDSEPAHYVLSLCYIRLNLMDEAVEQLETVIKLDPGNQNATYNLASLFEREGRYRQAIVVFRVSNSKHEDPAASLHLINLYFKVREDRRALLLAKQLVEHDRRGSVAAQVGVVLLQNNDYKEAVAVFEKIAPLAPRSLDLTVDLAESYLGANEPRRAIKLLTQFETIGRSWKVNALLGQAYELAAKPREAAAHLTEALASAPNQPALRYELGKLLLSSADQPTQVRGASEIQKAIDLDPHNAQYYIALSTWLLNRRYLKAAVRLLTQATRETQPSDKLYLMLGLGQFWLYGSNAAVPSLRTVLEINPHSAPAYNLLGGCYFSTGEYDRALNFYKKATHENPHDGLYFYNAGRTFDRLSRPIQALAFAEESVRLDPNSSMYHYLLGRIYFKLHRDRAAIRELKVALRLDPQSLPPYYLLARVYKRAGQAGEADLWSARYSNLRSEKDSLRNKIMSGSTQGPVSFFDASDMLKSLGVALPDRAPTVPTNWLQYPTSASR